MCGRRWLLLTVGLGAGAAAGGEVTITEAARPPEASVQALARAVERGAGVKLAGWSESHFQLSAAPAFTFVSWVDPPPKARGKFLRRSLSGVVHRDGRTWFRDAKAFVAVLEAAAVFADPARADAEAVFLAWSAAVLGTPLAALPSPQGKSARLERVGQGELKLTASAWHTPDPETSVVRTYEVRIRSSGAVTERHLDAP